MKKPEIYIRLESEGRPYGWWHFDLRGESYVIDGVDIMGEYNGEEYMRPAPCHSIKEAKREAKIAVNTAAYDGDYNPKATFWAFYKGDLVQIKFSKDGRHIKIVKKD